jgi:type VI secretion system protein ImpK
MDPDDPFGDITDIDETVIRPRPPARERSEKARPAAPAAALHVVIDEKVEKALVAAAINPVVGAAAPLLWLAARLTGDMAPNDVEDLRNRVLAEIRRFEAKAMASGVPPGSVRVACYVLSATLDDLILNTEWGSQSLWTTKGLVSSLYSESWGGERFFDILEQLLLDPNANVDVLELISICMALGFSGKYRIMAGGPTLLGRLRDDLYRTLRRVRGGYERDLSTSWRALDAAHRAPPTGWTAWIICGLALGLLLVAYVGFSLTLRTAADVAVTRLQQLVPPQAIARPAPPAPAPLPAPPPPPPKPLTQLERIEHALAGDIAGGGIAVVPNADTIVIRLSGSNVFASASTTLTPRFVPLVKDIAGALDREPGDIHVVGHTDNIPISGGAISSNQQLSEYRAKAVADIMRPLLTDPARLKVEGRGDAEPLVPNTTPENRAKNRRVDIELPRADKAP